ncbi:unnamed protein product [Brassica oleracea]
MKNPTSLGLLFPSTMLGLLFPSTSLGFFLFTSLEVFLFTSPDPHFHLSLSHISLHFPFHPFNTGQAFLSLLSHRPFHAALLSGHAFLSPLSHRPFHAALLRFVVISDSTHFVYISFSKKPFFYFLGMAVVQSSAVVVAAPAVVVAAATALVCVSINPP